MTPLRFAFLFVAILSSTSLAHAAEPPITDIAFAPDGRTLVAVSQVGLQLFSWPDLRHQHTLDTTSANLHCVVFAPSGRLLAVGGGNPSEEGIVEIFSWPAGMPIATISEHQDSVTSVSWLDSSQFFSASLDRRIQLFDLEKEGLLRSYEGHSRGVSRISLLNDQALLVSAGHDQSLRVWDTSTGKLVRSLNQHTKPIHAVALRPTDGGLPMVATAAGDRTIRFWQPTIGRMVRYIRLDAEPLNIAWTNNGTKVVAACVDGHVRVIDPAEVIVIQDSPAMDGWAYAIAVHPSDGSLAVGGTNGRIRRIELSEMQSSSAIR